MFLHLGADTIVPLKNLIIITDIKNGQSAINSEFLKVMHEESLISDVSDGNTKSFIVTDKMVYMSPISSLTLKKRANFLTDDDN
jgi:extracellular matrix regulatory protein B